MPKLIAAFCACHAKVQVRLQVSNQTQILEALSASNQDLAIMGQPPEDADLVARAFLDNPLVVIASPEHPLAAGRQIPLEQLGHQPFITREPGSGTRNAAERHFSRHGVEFNSVMEMSSNEAIKQAVLAGMAVSFLSFHTVSAEVAAGTLKVLDVEGLPMVRRWYVVHRRDKRLSPSGEAFRRFMIEEAGAFVERLVAPAMRVAHLRHRLLPDPTWKARAPSQRRSGSRT